MVHRTGESHRRHPTAKRAHQSAPWGGSSRNAESDLKKRKGTMTTMPKTEKRRGGSHVLRTGPSRHGNVSSSSNDNNNNNSSSSMTNSSSSNTSSGSSGGSSRRRSSSSSSSSSSTGAGDDAHDSRAATPTHHRDASSQLMEKDRRIAQLESEISRMQLDFLRDETQTSTFWQAKHSALHRQFLESDTELRLLRAEGERRLAERDELLHGWDVLRRELRQRDDHVRRLAAQVRGLKDFVSSSTRCAGAQRTSDEVFGDAMGRLANGLQNWVIIHFRRAKLDVSLADEKTVLELRRLVPSFERLLPWAKIHLLQSVVSKVLVESVFSAYFVGLSDEQARDFRRMERLLYSFSAPDEAVNQWRCSTLALLDQSPDEFLLRSETTALIDSVVSRINSLLDGLLCTSCNASRDGALRVLVNKAVDLGRLLAVQRAVLRVDDGIGSDFDAASMEDVGGLDEDALPACRLVCLVFPALIKHGDENGAQMQLRNVISKARVLCLAPE
ncbi:hypothetical protein XA68_11603 [Ophiocordyceps unilateralis]|uniref:Uncharacterized protein n=1 Tax=Ophiocordyceps unilateralis TaxID=268505 RepID=A0A2A9PF12_OPHUN|nr:hypothetical protein XA68_11603 [Ophiocordyceps unilateralis]